MRNPMILDRLMALSWFRRNWTRRLLLALLAAIFAPLIFIPRSYEARTTLTPREPFLADGYSTGTPPDPAIPGGRASVDVTLAVARSHDVRALVAARAASGDEARVARSTDVRALRAGIIEITAIDRNPGRALHIVRAYSDILRGQLDALTARQIRARRAALQRNFGQAQQRLAAAEAALAANPKDPALASARQYASRLRDSYTRFIDYSARDEIVGDGALTVVETPHVDPRRRLNMAAFGLVAMLVVLGCILELYLIRPPRRGLED